MFNFTLHVCTIFFHMVSIDVPVGVGAPPLNTTSPQSYSVNYASPLCGCWFGMGRCRTCSTGEDGSDPPARYPQIRR